ncbi:MAG: TolC family protein, partial [Alistipes sp.]|nr:TolC family protein [Alistipes sp.]
MRRVILMLGLAFAALSISAQSVSGEKLVLSLEQALEIALSENLTIKVADQEIEIKRYAKQGTYA